MTQKFSFCQIFIRLQVKKKKSKERLCNRYSLDKPVYAFFLYMRSNEDLAKGNYRVRSIKCYSTVGEAITCRLKKNVFVLIINNNLIPRKPKMVTAYLVPGILSCNRNPQTAMRGNFCTNYVSIKFEA